MAIELVHFSDCGPYRKSNQDAYCVRIAQTPMGIIAMAAVCDGMGGMMHGEIASASVVTGFGNWFDSTLPDFISSGLNASVISSSWNAILQGQHEKIRRFGQQNGIRLGTTASVLLIAGSEYYLLQVGDSRAYLDDTCQTRLLTVDQTLAMRELMAGRITEEEFASDDRRNILLQCVGDRTVAPVFQMGELPQRGSCMLCSDGFCHHLEPDMIHRVVAGESGRVALQGGMLGLGNMARSLGEKDNMTCVTLRWTDLNVAPEATVALMPELEHQNAFELMAKVTYTNSEYVF